MDLESARGFARREAELRRDITTHSPDITDEHMARVFTEEQPPSPEQRLSRTADRIHNLPFITHRPTDNSEERRVGIIFSGEDEGDIMLTLVAAYSYSRGTATPQPLTKLTATWSTTNGEFATEQITVAELQAKEVSSDAYRRLVLLEESMAAAEAALSPNHQPTSTSV